MTIVDWRYLLHEAQPGTGFVRCTGLNWELLCDDYHNIEVKGLLLCPSLSLERVLVST